MKTLSLTVTILLFMMAATANDSKYEQAMLSGIEMLNNARENDDFLNCANRFERIAIAEKNQWLPYYYASFSCIVMSYNETDNCKKDLILDRAQQLLDSAFARSENESEVHVLQAFLYPSRIVVDPMNRGMIYLDKCFQSLEMAKTLNPENPRVYYLTGIMKLNIPSSMGGGADIAKALFEEAERKFTDFKPSNSLMPVWGKENNRTELDKLAVK